METRTSIEEPMGDMPAQTETHAGPVLDKTPPTASETRQMRLAVVGVALLGQGIYWSLNRTPAYRVEALAAYLLCLHMMIVDGAQSPMAKPGRILAVCLLFVLIEVFRLMAVALWIRFGCYAMVVVFYAVDPDVVELEWK